MFTGTRSASRWHGHSPELSPKPCALCSAHRTVTVTDTQGLCSCSHGPENRACRRHWASVASPTSSLPAETGRRCHGQMFRPCVHAASSTRVTAVLLCPSLSLGSKVPRLPWSPMHSQPERSRTTVSAGCTGEVALPLCKCLLFHRSTYISKE